MAPLQALSLLLVSLLQSSASLGHTVAGCITLQQPHRAQGWFSRHGWVTLENEQTPLCSFSLVVSGDSNDSVYQVILLTCHHHSYHHHGHYPTVPGKGVKRCLQPMPCHCQDCLLVSEAGSRILEKIKGGCQAFRTQCCWPGAWTDTVFT